MSNSCIISECENKLQILGPDAMVQIIIKRNMYRRYERMRLAPNGPTGLIIGEVRPGEWMVDCKASEVIAWLKKGT